MAENIILRLEASERYLRLDSFASELFMVDHPLVRYEEIHINDNKEAVIPFHVHFEGFDVDNYTIDAYSGKRTICARPMLK